MRTPLPTINPLKLITFMFGRYHFTIFIVLIVGCLIGAIILLNTIVTDSSLGDGYTSAINAGSIDQATLDRLNTLHESNESYTLPSLPSGRINPFSE